MTTPKNSDLFRVVNELKKEIKKPLVTENHQSFDYLAKMNCVW